ncbi:hypothetical protein PHO31112_03539 [Pandoraea horticolens]|uniref:N-acetyltransferase ESCO zinc-finger domain-containing protein n=1 Tax=Pandoraea horticolens TaxID=2508298 RepID=A0A5E4WZC1_9BURK|nr:hypothetical protein [Pandoraea horticolens]VVE29035.1 hypothetical protein PHO31112_03539 [Pandoraea horticolens]
MAFKTSPEHFSHLFSALREPAPLRAVPTRVADALRRIAAERWIYRSGIEDLLFAMDPRLDDFGAGRVDSLVAMFQLHYRDIAAHPKKMSTMVMLLPALAATDFAVLLINLEALGFNVDATPLTEALSPELATRPFLSSRELTVIWHQNVRHRGEPLTVTALSAEPQCANRVTEWKVSTNYRVVALLDDGTPFRVTAHAPKYRRRPAPVETRCPTCDFTYYRGDSESTSSHRREHRIRLRYLEPSTHPKLATSETVTVTHLVTTKSPTWLHREIYDRALAFKREFRYDFTQWGSRNGDDDPDVEGHLMTAAGVILGACAFRMRQDGVNRYRALQWIWLAPKYRRAGHLSTCWAGLRRRYGAFHVEAPVSLAMQAFLARNSESWLMDVDAVLAYATTENATTT